MGHNVAVLKQNTDIPSFGDAARGAKEQQYIPPAYISAIIAHTRFVAGGKSDQIEFTLIKPGMYDFICSYPGDWGPMQGKIVAQ
jgi:azurin